MRYALWYITWRICVSRGSQEGRVLRHKGMILLVGPTKIIVLHARHAFNFWEYFGAFFCKVWLEEWHEVRIVRASLLFFPHSINNISLFVAWSLPLKSADRVRRLNVNSSFFSTGRATSCFLSLQNVRIHSVAGECFLLLVSFFACLRGSFSDDHGNYTNKYFRNSLEDVSDVYM